MKFILTLFNLLVSLLQAPVPQDRNDLQKHLEFAENDYANWFAWYEFQNQLGFEQSLNMFGLSYLMLCESLVDKEDPYLRPSTLPIPTYDFKEQLIACAIKEYSSIGPGDKDPPMLLKYIYMNIKESNDLLIIRNPTSKRYIKYIHLTRQKDEPSFTRIQKGVLRKGENILIEKVLRQKPLGVFRIKGIDAYFYFPSYSEISVFFMKDGMPAEVTLNDYLSQYLTPPNILEILQNHYSPH